METPFDQAQKFTSIWAEMAAKLASAGMTFDPAATATEAAEKSPPDMAKQVRDATFQTMSQYAQQFMRSEQFLEMMKKSMDASIAWQRQMNEFLTKAHHASESVARADVNDLHRSVRHLEQRTLDQMEQLAEKLDQISRRLDALDEKRTPDNGQVSSTGGVGGRQS